MHAYLPLAILNVFVVGNELPKLVRHNNAQGRDEMDSLLFLFYDYYPCCQDAKVLGAAAIYMGLMDLFAETCLLWPLPQCSHMCEGDEGPDSCQLIGFSLTTL